MSKSRFGIGDKVRVIAIIGDNGNLRRIDKVGLIAHIDPKPFLKPPTGACNPLITVDFFHQGPAGVYMGSDSFWPVELSKVC